LIIVIYLNQPFLLREYKIDYWDFQLSHWNCIIYMVKVKTRHWYLGLTSFTQWGNLGDWNSLTISSVPTHRHRTPHPTTGSSATFSSSVPLCFCPLPKPICPYLEVKITCLFYNFCNQIAFFLFVVDFVVFSLTLYLFFLLPNCMWSSWLFLFP
jgi:hypothetical protein